MLGAVETDLTWRTNLVWHCLWLVAANGVVILAESAAHLRAVGCRGMRERRNSGRVPAHLLGMMACAPAVCKPEHHRILYASISLVFVRLCVLFTLAWRGTWQPAPAGLGVFPLVVGSVSSCPRPGCGGWVCAACRTREEEERRGHCQCVATGEGLGRRLLRGPLTWMGMRRAWGLEAGSGQSPARACDLSLSDTGQAPPARRGVLLRAAPRPWPCVLGQRTGRETSIELCTACTLCLEAWQCAVLWFGGRIIVP